MRTPFNPKRRVCSSTEAKTRLLEMDSRVPRYNGNPAHKKNAGDFGLDPPSSPRQDKTLCDAAGIFSRSEALKPFRQGISKGLFGVQGRAGWPQNILAVAKGGYALEAQLEGDGVYHGYPMPSADPLRAEILGRWEGS